MQRVSIKYIDTEIENIQFIQINGGTIQTAIMYTK